jgi:hypothetical protein
LLVTISELPKEIAEDDCARRGALFSTPKIATGIATERLATGQYCTARRSWPTAKSARKIRLFGTAQYHRVRAKEFFKTGALNRSATLPSKVSQALRLDADKNKLRIGPNSQFGMLTQDCQ